jgi:Transposase DDE domain group 1
LTWDNGLDQQIITAQARSIFQMRSSHTAAAVSAIFDDENLIGYGGLEPTVRLAERCGLPTLVDRHLHITDAANSGGACATAKVMSIVAGMLAGADSIDDLDRLRHSGMEQLFDGVRAPSTLGTFLRSFTHGHNRQLHAVHRRFLANLATATDLLPDAHEMTYLDIDPSHVRVYGAKKQGAEYGRLKGQRTLHPLLCTISTPTAAPVFGPVRLRRGKAADVRGAVSFVTEAINTARDAGATGTILVRADAKFYTAEVVDACLRAETLFSLSTGINPDITAAIGRIPESDWEDIVYPHPIEDPDTGELISQAQVARIRYTAFVSRRQRWRVTAWLIVRRVRRHNTEVAQGQGELFAEYRYHPVFTNNPAALVEAETTHRQHAIVEPAIADLKASALAHLPSGSFQANNAWLTLGAIAHNVTRAAGCTASPFHAKAETATIRDQLIHVPARIAHSARRLVLHLPAAWPWEHAWQTLFTAVHPPPTPSPS